MLLPQFSLRWMLTATAALAAVFLVISQAYSGHGWALGVTAAFAALVGVLAVHAMLFLAVWLFSLAQQALRGGRKKSGASPFKAVQNPFAPQRPVADPPTAEPA